MRAAARLALNRDRAVDFPQDRPANRQTEPVAVRLVVKNGSSTRGRFSRGIPHPVSAIAMLTTRSAERMLTTIRTPCGVASRALVSRFRNTCSRSLWLQATAGTSSGMSTCNSMALRLMPYLRMADAVSIARRTCPSRLRRAALRENVSIPPKMRRQT
jgi:hypothetical protein